MKKMALIVMTWALAGLFSAALTAQTDEPALTVQEMEAMVADIEELYYSAQEALQSFPSERFNSGLILENHDYDAEAIIKWVREETRWIPYQGVLRGAQGVLLDRSGNALDRSLLLFALLADAGYEVRLVRGELSAADAQGLQAEMESQAPPPLAYDQLPTERGRSLAAKAGQQATALHELLGSDLKIAKVFRPESNSDHWWVEYEDGPQWKTVDILSSANGGGLEPKVVSRHRPDDIPETLYHTVTIRVVVERFDQGKLREFIPLEHTFRAAQAPTQYLELIYIPYGFESPEEGASDEARIEMVSRTAQDWLPVLRSRDDQFIQSGFSQSGNLEKNPAKPAVQRKFSGASSALSGLGESAPEQETVLSALHLEYQIDAPGRDAVVTRREIFDLIGPERRLSGSIDGFEADEEARMARGLALFTRTRILLNSADLPFEALERAELDLWAHHGHQIAGMVRLMQDPTVEEPLTRLASIPLPPLDLMLHTNSRKEFFRFRNRTFVETPNIVTSHDYMLMDGQINTGFAVDIVSNQIGVSGQEGARVRLEQGVLDTLLESEMPGTSGDSSNTAVLFENRGSTPWNVQQGDSALAAQSPEAWARMHKAIESGRIVVAPAQYAAGTEPAWWEIDSTSGLALGIGRNGWGVEATENTIQRGGTSAGMKEVTKKQGMKVSCRIVQAAGYIDAAVDVVEPEPWFAAQDRKLHTWRMNQKWRAKHLRTIGDLDRMMEKGCK